MTDRAFKQDVRDRMARTGGKYTKALRAIEEVQAAPSADVYKSTSGEPYYFVETYDHTPYGPYGNVLAYADETDDTYEGLLSADGDGIEWETLAGKTQIATAILEHWLRAQPSQDLIDEFLMNIASRWKDGYQPTVFVGQIRVSLGVQRGTRTGPRASYRPHAANRPRFYRAAKGTARASAAVPLRSRVAGTAGNRRERSTKNPSVFAAFASVRGELQGSEPATFHRGDRI
jgi:hypothetical protein